MSAELTNIIAAGLVLAANQILNLVRTEFQIKREDNKLDGFKEALETVRKQVMPNGGSSLNDKITQLTHALDTFSSLTEKKWYLQLDALPTPIYISNLDGDCIYGNDALAKLFRVDKSELLNNGWLKRIKNKPQAFNNWNESVHKDITYRDEYELITDENEVYAKCSAKSDLIKDSKGNPLFYYGHITEIK